MARPAGFKPTTPWFVAKYSIQLSYGRNEQSKTSCYHVMQSTGRLYQTEAGAGFELSLFYNTKNIQHHQAAIDTVDSPSTNSHTLICGGDNRIFNDACQDRASKSPNLPR